MTMLIVALLFIAFSAGTGFTVAYSILSKRLPTAKAPVVMHGMMSSVGLVLLIIYYIGHAETFPLSILLTFVATALVGFYLFRNDVFKQSPGPVVVIVLHVLFALAAVTLLALFIW